MPTTNMMLAVAFSGFALSASPGPSMFYILSRSVSQNRNAGLASALGLALGGVLLAIGSALGLSALFERVPTAFTALQVGGGLYLLHLGVGMIREAKDAKALAVLDVEPDPLSHIFRQGVVVELLNPKTAIFLVAFIPQFIDETRTDTRWQILVLSMLVPLTAIPADVLVSFCGGSLAARFKANPNAAVIMNGVAGLILVGLAARVFLMVL